MGITPLLLAAIAVLEVYATPSMVGLLTTIIILPQLGHVQLTFQSPPSLSVVINVKIPVYTSHLMELEFAVQMLLHQQIWHS